jgi:hypothetical protein
MTQIVEWLRAKSSGFNLLSDEELGAISDFSLLWSLFESRLLGTEGSARAILGILDGWRDAGNLNASSFDPELAYFRQRYFVDGAFTDHFDGLHLRRNDEVPLVRAVIDGSDNDPRNRLAAMLIIVFRYRNNLFHGVKWHYKLAGQLGNFSTANALLMKVLEQHGALADG